MAQAETWGAPTQGPLPMSGYSSRLNPMLNALLTAHRGGTRPTYAQGGTIWINDTDPQAWALNVFDGTSDVAIGTINTTTHLLTIATASIPLLQTSKVQGLVAALSEIEGDIAVLQLALNDFGAAADLGVATTADMRAGTGSGVLTPATVLDAMNYVAITPAATVAINHALGSARSLFCNANTIIGVPTNSKIGWPLKLLITTNGFTVGWSEPNSADPNFLWGADGQAFIPVARALVTFECIATGKYLYLGAREY